MGFDAAYLLESARTDLALGRAVDVPALLDAMGKALREKGGLGEEVWALLGNVETILDALAGLESGPALLAEVEDAAEHPHTRALAETLAERAGAADRHEGAQP